MFLCIPLYSIDYSLSTMYNDDILDCMKKVTEVSDTYYKPDEVATLLKVTKQAVYNWINEGRLKAVKAGRATRVSREALAEFLEPAEPGHVESAGDARGD